MPAKRITLTCKRCRRILDRDAFALWPRTDGPYTRPDPLCRDCRPMFDAEVEARRRHPNTEFLCACGCSRPTNLAPITDEARGWVRGQPMKYIRGHNTRATPYPAAPYRVDAETGCWIWQLGLKRGYSRLERNGRRRSGHTFYYEARFGPVPDGMVVDHICPHGANPACVNPDHLRLLSRSDNSRFKRSTKLSYEAAREIRRLAPTMSLAAIGRQFGVSPTTIYAVIKGHHWPEDEAPE